LRENKVKKKERKRRRMEDIRKVKRELLREVIVKIGLERIDIQEGIIIETLLDSRAIRLVISLEFAKRQRFKLKKINKSIYKSTERGQRLI